VRDNFTISCGESKRVRSLKGERLRKKNVGPMRYEYLKNPKLEEKISKSENKQDIQRS
jgi:hypothetical protein